LDEGWRGGPIDDDDDDKEDVIEGPEYCRDGPEGGSREVEEAEDSLCRGVGAYLSPPLESWYPDILTAVYHSEPILLQLQNVISYHLQ
jgi:hypothetical protein